MVEKYIHSPEQERRVREAALDQTIEATFPASDPASSIPDPHDRYAYEQRIQADRLECMGNST